LPGHIFVLRRRAAALRRFAVAAVTAALLEEGQTVVDEGQAVTGVVYRPEAVSLSRWPRTGPWSRVRRDPKTGVGVPLLRVPDLDRCSFQRLAGLAAARGLINKGELHLAQYLQDNIDAGGAIAWYKRHLDMTDFAQHYGDYTTTDDAGKPAGPKPKKCSANTFWRRLGVLRHELGILWRVEAASKGCPPRYEACVRADSPLLADLPEDLARALRLDVLARLLSEHEVPVSNEPDPSAALTEIVELYGGAQLEPEQHADAAAVSRAGQYEIAMMHARTPEQEATIARLAVASSRGWADPAGRPAPPPVSEVPHGDVHEPVKPKQIALPGKPLPAALRSDLARLGSIKRTVLKSVELAAYGPRTKMQNATYYREGVSLTNAFDFGFSDARVASQDGRSKAKKAPTARNINGGAGSDLAAGGWPVVQEGVAEALRAVLPPRRATVDVREGARVARRAWAMWRRERPRATWLGKWVEGSDGVATWDYGDEGWESLSRLIAQCLRRVPESMILSHARGAIAPNVRNPLDVFAWRLHNKIMPLAPYTERRDAAKPAAYVLEEQDLSPAVKREREKARNAAKWTGVHPAESIAAGELAAAREKARAGSAKVASAETVVPEMTPEQEQARRERLAAREAALREDELWRQRKAESAAAADAALAEVVRITAEQQAQQDAERARAEAAALAEHDAKRCARQLQAPAKPEAVAARAKHGQDDEHAAAHAVAKQARKAKKLLAQGFGQTETTAPVPAAADEAPSPASRVADRLARWTNEGRLSGGQDGSAGK
jgi:hypothetical protein